MSLETQTSSSVKEQGRLGDIDHRHEDFEAEVDVLKNGIGGILTQQEKIIGEMKRDDEWQLEIEEKISAQAEKIAKQDAIIATLVLALEKRDSGLKDKLKELNDRQMRSGEALDALIKKKNARRASQK